MNKHLREDLNRSARRHAKRLIDKIAEVIDVPGVVVDSISKEMEYATLDGQRITERHRLGRGGES